MSANSFVKKRLQAARSPRTEFHLYHPRTPVIFSLSANSFKKKKRLQAARSLRTESPCIVYNFDQKQINNLNSSSRTIIHVSYFTHLPFFYCRRLAALCSRCLLQVLSLALKPLLCARSVAGIIPGHEATIVCPNCGRHYSWP